MTLKYDPKTGEWTGTTGGVDLQELDRKAKAPKKSPQKSSDRVREENMKNPYYGYAYRLFDHVKTQMEFTELGKLVFRNMQNCDYNPQSKNVRFGYQIIDHFVEKGYTEYKSIASTWNQNGYDGCGKMTGKQAVWATILHEIAHHSQDLKNGFWRGSVHNHYFIKALEELIVLFPFEEVEFI